MSERRIVTVDGRPVRYRVDGTGPPLILVHGLSGSVRWWARNIAPLGERFRVHAVDLPGFGENRSWGQFSLEQVAGRLVAWMDAIGIERFSIVGHSMGGFIAADLAAGIPNRVNRLVLVDSPVLPGARGFIRMGVRGAAATRKLPLRFVPILIADAVRAGPFTLGSAGRALLAADLSPRLHLIRAETLVVWGKNDHLFSEDYGRRVAAAIASAEFVLLEKAGHNAMWDEPGAFNRAVLDFLT